MEAVDYLLASQLIASELACIAPLSADYCSHIPSSRLGCPPHSHIHITKSLMRFCQRSRTTAFVLACCLSLRTMSHLHYFFPWPVLRFWKDDECTGYGRIDYVEAHVEKIVFYEGDVSVRCWRPSGLAWLGLTATLTAVVVLLQFPICMVVISNRSSSSGTRSKARVPQSIETAQPLRESGWYVGSWVFLFTSRGLKSTPLNLLGVDLRMTCHMALAPASTRLETCTSARLVWSCFGCAFGRCTCATVCAFGARFGFYAVVVWKAVWSVVVADSARR